MAEKYITHNVLLESADFHVLIIEFPDADVNDKLSLLASEKGLIYRHLYEDFVIGTCMSNAGPFFYHIRKRPELLTKFAEIRKEALAAIFKYSPGFKPENIVINQNNILKVLRSVRPDEKVRPLMENDLWNQDPTNSNFGPAIITSSPAKKGPNPFRDEEDENLEPLDELPDNPFGNSSSRENIDVPYELVGHKWEKAGLHVNVRKYEESDGAVISLLGGTPFESTRGYHLLIVERCIEDFADLFQILDQMGLSKTTNPSILLEELYNIAIEHNSFLKLENVDLKSVRSEYKNQQKTRMRGTKRTARAGTEDKVVSVRKRNRFEDLTKPDLLSLGDRIKKKIVGQDAAVQTIADSVKRASVGLKRAHEPLGVFLFMGSTGTGKTETAKILAECLNSHLIRIDCQDYQQAHEAAKLTGSPPGYVGYEDGGFLAKEVSKHPFSVVCLDEIEKAHSNFHEKLLQIIDDGILRDNAGKLVPFNECLIVMTSNIGVKEVADINNKVGFGGVAEQTDVKLQKARLDALNAKFRPEFINRIDEIVNFRRLDRDDYLGILEVLLTEIKEQVQKSRGITLAVNAVAKDFLLEKGIDKKFGARPLRRALKRYLNTPLADAILSETVDEKSKVNVGMNLDKDGLTFKPAIKKKTASVE